MNTILYGILVLYGFFIISGQLQIQRTQRKILVACEENKAYVILNSLTGLICKYDFMKYKIESTTDIREPGMKPFEDLEREFLLLGNDIIFKGKLLAIYYTPKQEINDVEDVKKLLRKIRYGR